MTPVKATANTVSPYRKASQHRLGWHTNHKASHTQSNDTVWKKASPCMGSQVHAVTSADCRGAEWTGATRLVEETEAL
jgi:hypothetical protein